MITGRPNILLFFPDQLHPDWDGFDAQIPVRTPHLHALAARGVRFTDVLCPSPLCAPSRAALASGKNYRRCGVESNGENYPVEQTTIYSLLRDSGYHTAGCGKFDLHKPDFSWGPEGQHLLNDWGFSGGIDSEGKIDGLHAALQNTPGPYLTYLKKHGLDQVHIDDFQSRRGNRQNVLHPTELDDEHYCDNWIARNGLELIDRVPNGQPWFLQVNFDGPHAPMDITKTMKEWYKDTRFRRPEGNTNLSEEEHQEILRNYAAMIENIDRHLGIYIKHLEDTGQLENTLIIFSADHGDTLGAQNHWGKCQPERGSVNVPLVMAGPGIPASGTDIRAPQSSLDLSATILDAAGLAVPDDMDSRSLFPVTDGSSSGRDYIESALSRVNRQKEFNGWKLIYDGRYKLIVYNDGKKILRDLKSDPAELTDFSADCPDIVKQLSVSMN